MNNLNLLVVETGVAEAQKIEGRLSPAGHHVCLVGDENEAVEVLLMQQFDAVILGPSQSADAIASFRIQLNELAQLQRSFSSLPLLAVAGSAESSAALPADAVLEADFAEELLAKTLRHLAAAIPAPQSPAAPGSLEVFNPAGFEEQCSKERDLMVEIIDLFAVECGRQLPEMEAALNTGAFESLSRLAHTMKGSLGSLHAPLAWQTAQNLEKAAQAEDATECRELLCSFGVQLDELKQELQSFREACLCSPGQ